MAAGIAACWLIGDASATLPVEACIFINSANWSLPGASGALGVSSFFVAAAAPKLLARH